MRISGQAAGRASAVSIRQSQPPETVLDAPVLLSLPLLPLGQGTHLPALQY